MLCAKKNNMLIVSADQTYQRPVSTSYYKRFRRSQTNKSRALKRTRLS